MPSLTESWISDQGQAGSRLAGSGDGFAVVLQPQEEDDYVTIFDTSDGHPLRIPLQDKRYQLAKVRPTTKGQRATWVRIQGRGNGVVHYAPGGSVPAYSETPPATLQPDRNQPVALADGVKSVRRSRKRGKRGKGKVSL